MCFYIINKKGVYKVQGSVGSLDRIQQKMQQRDFLNIIFHQQTRKKATEKQQTNKHTHTHIEWTRFY